jgi:hypothetical protein
VPDGWHPGSAVAIPELPLDGETLISMIPKVEPNEDGPRRSRPFTLLLFFFFWFIERIMNQVGNVNLVVVGVEEKEEKKRHKNCSYMKTKVVCA